MASSPRSIRLFVLFILAGLFCMVLFTHPARAARPVQLAAPQPTATLEEAGGQDTAGTPALLLTPLATQPSDERPVRPGAVWATAALFMCTMIAMLIGGIGIAVVFYRLRMRMQK
jgi:hypothetical protein